MRSPERRALALLLALAVGGHLVRWGFARPADPPGQIALLGQLPARSASAQRDSIRRQARPLAAGERLDLDVASPAALTRLPRIGPALARRIVADRERRGPFGSLAGLDRVAGVGPSLLQSIEPHAAFSGAPRADPVPAPGGTSRAGGDAPAFDWNRASEAEPERLPWVGPVRARAIVQYRDRHGPIGTAADLAKVPGVSEGLAARLWERTGRRP